MSDLRPCIVRTKREINSGTNHILQFEIMEHKGHFHKWYDRFWTTPAIMIGDVGGQMSQCFGVVEYEDGSIHEHLPEEIQFTDRK